MDVKSCAAEVPNFVTARYLNGDDHVVGFCATINHARVAIASKQNRFAPDVCLFRDFNVKNDGRDDDDSGSTDRKSVFDPLGPDEDDEPPPSLLFAIFLEPDAPRDYAAPVIVNDDRRDWVPALTEDGTVWGGPDETDDGDDDTINDGEGNGHRCDAFWRRTFVCHARAGDAAGVARALCSSAPLHVLSDALRECVISYPTTTHSSLGILLDHHADIDYVGHGHTAEAQRTLLHWACEQRMDALPLVRFLLSRSADVNARDRRSKCPIHAATDVAVVRLLADYHADVDAADRGGGTAIFRAATFGRVDIVRFLIGVNADVHVTNVENGWTSLHSASLNGYAEAVELLLEAKADVELTDYNGRTSMSLARFCGQREAVEMLQRYGAVLDY
eukprot:GEMP01042488.1.p1 GENE.GEMP01042488.1~~GEMP01042488.1.p1  ORF type:complete len:389 (+),score=139.04 GEMP01042488.1:97-1263(+)